MSALNTTHVLVVDDEEGIRELFRRMLTPAGYVVQTAPDAQAALNMLAAFRPAVVIIDIHMPGPSGLWLADQVRAASPHAAMILATSDANVPASASLKPGIIEYIVKPLDKATVLKAITAARKWSATASGVPLEDEGDGEDLNRHFSFLPHRSAARPHAHASSGRASRSRRWIGAAAVVVVLGVAAGLYLGWPGGDPVKLVSAATGTVRVFDESGASLAQGTGFFVAPDVLITDHHVVDGGTRASVTMAGGVVIPVTGVLAVDRAHDLVALKTARPGTAVLAVSAAEPRLGDPIEVYGAPLGLSGTLSTGIISVAPEENPERLQFSAPISPGSSGSPVVTPRGEVVGVVIATQITGQAINFAAPARFVRALLAEGKTVRPLASVARGAGDDRERNELVGPVKVVTIYAPESLAARRERLVAEYGKTMRASEAERRADREALAGTWVRLQFDQGGHLVQRTLGDERTITRYFYDDNGRLQTETRFEGDTPVFTWRFVPVGTARIKATDVAGGIARELAYDALGRLAEERTESGNLPGASTFWHYDQVGWPHPLREGEAEPQVELDVLGNATKRVEPDGSTTTFVCRFDARSNWVSRNTMKGTETVAVERRDIEYWK